MMFLASRRFTLSSMAARVVDFPEPTVPQTRTSPRCREAISSTMAGRCRSSNAGTVAGTCRKTIAVVPRC